MSYKLFVVFFLCLFTTFSAFAQRKAHSAPVFWPEMQADYVVKDQNYFYFRNQYRINSNGVFNDLAESGPFSAFERIQFQLGYEQFFSDHWSGGLSGRYAIENFPKMFFSEVFLRHTGNIEKLRFIKKASLEHIIKESQENSGRLRILVDVDRTFDFKGKVIRPRIGYELFFNFDFEDDKGQESNERRVDRTRLRLDATYELNKHLFITPYYTKQTDYLLLSPTFDDKMQIKDPGGKRNRITSIWGLELRYTFYKDEESISPRFR